MNQIQVVFDNNQDFAIQLKDNSIVDSLKKMLKHLQNTNLVFTIADNPYKHQKDIVLQQLVDYSKKFNIDLDPNRLHNQDYLNWLHTHYATNYNGDSDWMLYHSAIHMMEFLNSKRDIKELPVSLTYKEKSGPIKRPFDYAELANMQSRFSAGECAIMFDELGKVPFKYWKDGESNDIAYLCELAKPMLDLKFQIAVFLHDIDFLPNNKDARNFEDWFSTYKKDWCRHWKVPDWSLTQMLGGISIGTVANIKEFDNALKIGQVPKQCRLV
jgi:hypothetical protein